MMGLRYPAACCGVSQFFFAYFGSIFPFRIPSQNDLNGLNVWNHWNGASISFQAVEALGIAVAHGVFVLCGKPLVFVQFLQFFLTGIVVDFVRKVGREDKRFVADDTDGKGQGKLVAFDANINAPFVNVTLDVAGDRFFVAEL